MMIKEATGFSTLGDLMFYAKDVDVAASSLQAKFHMIDLTQYPAQLHPDDLVVAVRCFDAIEKKARETKSVSARVVTGLRYEFGMAGDVDKEEALRFYTLAAAQNDPIAQYAVSRFYRDGIHLRPNPAKQRQWLNDAAKHGFGPAVMEITKGDIGAKASQSIDWRSLRQQFTPS